MMTIVFGLLMGIGLSAACGFRVSVPLLVYSVAAHTGHYHPPAALEWVGSTPALVAFGVAAVVEVLGYMVPWLDHLLDVLAVPAAIAAGTVITSGMLGDESPVLRWSVALIAGGGAAGVTGLTTATIRGGSTATTGGLANPVFALFETMFAFLTALLAMVLPLIAIGMVIFFLLSLGRVVKRIVSRRKGKSVEVTTGLES